MQKRRMALPDRDIRPFPYCVHVGQGVPARTGSGGNSATPETQGRLRGMARSGGPGRQTVAGIAPGMGPSGADGNARIRPGIPRPRGRLAGRTPKRFVAGTRRGVQTRLDHLLSRGRKAAPIHRCLAAGHRSRIGPARGRLARFPPGAHDPALPRPWRARGTFDRWRTLDAGQRAGRLYLQSGVVVRPPLVPGADHPEGLPVIARCPALVRPGGRHP